MRWEEKKNETKITFQLTINKKEITGYKTVVVIAYHQVIRLFVSPLNHKNEKKLGNK